MQLILGFGGFVISLVGLCYKIFKDDNKNNRL
ncbi:putative holin-like toxin [Streptococcus suis]|nr:putative holin-like toxin [Streptococcus suis]MDG3136934.1 putative holin-like toxin [Streptococcus suis]